MIAARVLALLLLALLPSACNDAEQPTAIEDPAKLSEELEAEAQEIEQRADAAVREAEALAERELQALRAEADAAQSSDTAASPPESNK
jgi:hypothetical protein